MKLIGFGHRKRSGKDTAGEFLAKEFGFRRVAFADPLKRAAMEIFGFTHKQCYGSVEDKETVDPRWGFSPRHAMQLLGETMRQAVGPDVWIKSAEATIMTTPYANTRYNPVSDDTLEAGSVREDWKPRDGGENRVVITDVRHPNEGDMIKRLGGITVRIDRPSLGPNLDTHISETAMESYDYDEVILNDGTLNDLYSRINKIFLEYGTAH